LQIRAFLWVQVRSPSEDEGLHKEEACAPIKAWKRTMKTLTRSLTWAAALIPAALAQNATITLAPAAIGFDSDNAALIYAPSPILLANDGSAPDGGFRTFTVSNSTNSTLFTERSHEKSGRTKIAIPVYDVGGRDVVFNIPSPNSVIRAYDVKSGIEVEGSRRYQLGDWSVARNWRSQTSGENYVFLFGKKMVVQFLVKGDSDSVEVLEVRETGQVLTEHS
jgi:3-phytase